MDESHPFAKTAKRWGTRRPGQSLASALSSLNRGFCDQVPRAQDVTCETMRKSMIIRIRGGGKGYNLTATDLNASYSNRQAARNRLGWTVARFLLHQPNV